LHAEEDANMSFIVSIEGPHGVGKSTLVESLRQSFPGAGCFEEEGHKELRVKREESGLALSCEEDFFRIQEWYVDFECSRWERLQQYKKAFTIRGPEAKEFFLLHYPRTIGANWDLEGRFAESLYRLRRCRSNRVLYLDAPTEVVSERLRARGRPRLGIQDWVERWLPYYSIYFKSNPKTVVLDTSSMSNKDVSEWAAKWVASGCPLEMVK
jgi:thymidylate kinase